MFQNTLDGLAHPLILETAKNLAYKQVGLGFCRPQDHQDLMQDLLLYLCKQVSRYTGELDLVTWACRLLHGRINRINRRLLGIPSPSQQRRSPQPHDATQLNPLKPVFRTCPVPQEAACLLQPDPQQQEQHPVSQKDLELSDPTVVSTNLEPATIENQTHETETPNQVPPQTPTPFFSKTESWSLCGVIVGKLNAWWNRLHPHKAAAQKSNQHPP